MHGTRLRKEFHEISQCLQEISPNGQTQELKLRRHELSHTFNLEKCNFEWQKIVNDSMGINNPLDSIFLIQK